MAEKVENTLRTFLNELPAATYYEWDISLVFGGKP
jgi:hypothetical protein